jgi:hypothetical protein
MRQSQILMMHKNAVLGYCAYIEISWFIYRAYPGGRMPVIFLAEIPQTCGFMF